MIEKKLYEAVRKDGSEAGGSTMKFPDGREYTTRGVKLISEKKRVYIDEATESISTEYISPEKLSRPHIHTDKTCVVKHGDPKRYTVIGYDNVLGFDVVKLVFEDTKAGLRLEQWESPALDCAQLLWVAEWRKDGKLVSRQERRAVSVKVGEPDQAYFSVPVNYVERSPSQIMTELGRRHWGECPHCSTPAKLERMDRNYRDSQKYGPK